MQFGVSFVNTGYGVTPEGATAIGLIAEEYGFESLWTVEHVVVPAEYRSTYPYSTSGRMPGTEESPIPDPLIWLAWVAATTRTLRLATGILILPQRNPVVLAKELATLDLLSSGRVTLGVGVGWLREEFEALGVPFDDRGARTDEHIEVLRALWTEPVTTWDGRFVQLDSVKSYPKPVQPGGIPIAIGGHSSAAARRAGRLGDEFFPATTEVDQLAELVGVMRHAAKEAGRDPASIGITVGGPADAAGVRRLAEMGVTRVVVPNIGRDPESWRRRLGKFADEVISARS